jgi:hypothetical protein
MIFRFEAPRLAKDGLPASRMSEPPCARYGVQTESGGIVLEVICWAREQGTERLSEGARV